ncbi:MAG: tetratricopeptide repeat protein [Myxococcota bacterium]
MLFDSRLLLCVRLLLFVRRLLFGRLLGELAEALVPLGRVSAAIRALRRRAALEDDLHERARLHGRAAQLLREEGDAQGALRELDRALRFAPRNPSLLVARADVRTSLGQQEQASKELESALDRTPPHEQEALLVSALRLHAGLEASALDALAERAFASSPVPPAVISALLDSASAVGDETLIYRALSAADAWTEQPGDLPPPRLDLHRHAAALHVAAGRRPEAIAHLRLLTTSPRATGEDLIALERLALDADLPELVEFARSRRVSAALAARRPSEIVDVFRSTIEQADPASDAHQTARRALGEALQRFPADRALLDVALEGARRAKDSAALIELLQTRLQEQE